MCVRVVTRRTESTISLFATILGISSCLRFDPLFCFLFLFVSIIKSEHSHQKRRQTASHDAISAFLHIDMDSNLIERILEFTTVCAPVLVATMRCPSLVHCCASKLPAHHRLAALVFLRDLMRALCLQNQSDGSEIVISSPTSQSLSLGGSGGGGTSAAAASLMKQQQQQQQLLPSLLQQFRNALLGQQTNPCRPDQDEPFGISRLAHRGLVHGDENPLRQLLKHNPQLVKFFSASLFINTESGEPKYATSERELKAQIAAMQPWRVPAVPARSKRDLHVGSDEDDTVASASIPSASVAHQRQSSSPKVGDDHTHPPERDAADASSAAVGDEESHNSSVAATSKSSSSSSRRYTIERLRRIADNITARLPRATHLEVEKGAASTSSALAFSAIVAAQPASGSSGGGSAGSLLTVPSTGSNSEPHMRSPTAAALASPPTMSPRQGGSDPASGLGSSHSNLNIPQNRSTAPFNHNNNSYSSNNSTLPPPHFELPTLVGSVDAIHMFLLEYPQFAAVCGDLRVTSRDALVSLNTMWCLSHPTIDEDVAFIPPLPSSESPDSVATSTSTLATVADATRSDSNRSSSNNNNSNCNNMWAASAQEREEEGHRQIQRAVNVNARNIERQLRKAGPVDMRAPAHILEDEPWHLWQDVAAFSRYERSVVATSAEQKRAAAYGSSSNSSGGGGGAAAADVEDHYSHLRKACGGCSDPAVLDCAMKLSMERPLEDRVRFLLELNLATQRKVPEETWRAMLRVLDKAVTHIRKSRPAFEGAAFTKDKLGVSALEMTDRFLGKTVIPTPSLRPHELGTRISDFFMNMIADFTQVADRHGCHEIFAAPGEAAVATSAMKVKSSGGAAEESEVIQTLRQLVTVLKWAARESEKLAQEAKEKVASSSYSATAGVKPK